jgi:hypothetical protein
MKCMLRWIVLVVCPLEEWILTEKERLYTDLLILFDREVVESSKLLDEFVCFVYCIILADVKCTV